MIEKNILFKSEHAQLKMEHLYNVEINATFSISVDSYGFCGSYNFCIHDNDMTRILLELQELNDRNRKLCRISDCDSDAYLCLEIKCKNIKVSGQLGGSYEDNFIKFGFSADFSLIASLIKIISGSRN